MKYDLSKLSSQFDKVEQISKDIDTQEKINKYGTFLDSKKDIIQLYVLFIFFGIHGDVIQQFPDLHDYSVD